MSYNLGNELGYSGSALDVSLALLWGGGGVHVARHPLGTIGASLALVSVVSAEE